MKKLFKIHESDIHTMVENVSKKILKEEFAIKEVKKTALTENDMHRVVENATKRILKEQFNLK